MQDKDFDQLFKDRFDDAEIQPSANLWDNISQELAPKKKRKLPVWWMAAAVVFIAVTIGLLYPETESIKLQGKEVAAIQPSAAAKPADVVSMKKANVNSTPLVLAPRLKEIQQERKNNLVAMHPIEANHRPVNTVTETIPQLKEEPVQPAQHLPEVMIAKVEVPEVQQEQNVITEREEPERKGIRNVGDVINFVVDKIDKREHKLIRFKTDDDDNSSLVAINIGILKFNPKRNK